ncbi:hypothetical protein O3P69_000208 [Scylla paramamosain]|uniref:Uncharacterized protein n=1 Tax=Scylla paramamosain TaxID=85552 RepID=A0AAW0UXS3_SCYPA
MQVCGGDRACTVGRGRGVGGRAWEERHRGGTRISGGTRAGEQDRYSQDRLSLDIPRAAAPPTRQSSGAPAHSTISRSSKHLKVISTHSNRRNHAQVAGIGSIMLGRVGR